MTRLQACAIAATPDQHPEEYARLVRIAAVYDDDAARWGVEFWSDYAEWTDYDRREALESLRQMR